MQVMKLCSSCGFSNPDAYRFCADCGKGLIDGPAHTTPQVAAAPQLKAEPISGPSILGLNAASQEEDSLSYLLEEDEPKSHRGGYILLCFAILLFIAAAVFVIYQKYYFVPAYARTAPVATVPGFAYDHTPPLTFAETALATAALDPVVPGQKVRDQLALENISAIMRNLKAQDKLAATADPRLSKADGLLATGEKYLYGRGVVTNCELAAKNLQDAADAGSAKAMAHLGSMYGSGRCVKFNRVKAYEWFAKAKNSDPENTWVEASMDMLWRNMSRRERAAILK
jgi:hypothetical protein